MTAAQGSQNSAYYVGKVVKAVAARYDAKMTEPPKRYTEDTLIADMLSAHKFATSEQERAILRETEGLGTSRTRASTIEGLINGGFLISKKKKKLYELQSSDLARTTMAHLPDILTSVATTAKWEVAFKMIERGATTTGQVRQALRTNLDYIVQAAKSTGSIKMPGSQAAPAGTRFSGSQPKAAQPAPVAKSPAPGAAGKGVSSWFR